jgi:radical SAM protein with 4Fe4S-binding SPASM domain
VRSFTEKNKDRHPLREILPLDMPLGLTVEPTNLCNFRCVQCPVSLAEFAAEAGPLGHMDMGLYGKIIEDVRRMGRLNNLQLYGDGEPFLNPKLAEMIRRARDAGVARSITVTTNGSVMNHKLAAELVASGLDYLRVSVYSLYPERFARITGSRMKPETIRRNLRLLRSVRDAMGSVTPFLYVKMIDTYSAENEEFFSAFRDVADEVNIEAPMNWNGYDGIDLIGRIDPARRTDETLVQGYHRRGLGRLPSGLKEVCTTPFLALNIKRDGVVVVCIVDWNKGTRVGDIRRQSLSEIWFGEELRRFREMHIRRRRHENPSCRNCKFLYANPDNMDGFSEDAYRKILDHAPEVHLP